jgi:hypothetical protein
MRSLSEYLFGPINEKGVTLPVNRFEICLSCVLALALMVAMALVGEPWGRHSRNLLIGVVAITLIVFAITKRRRMVLAIALVLAAARAILGGILGGEHVLLFVSLGVALGIAGWLLSRDSQGW